MDDSHLVDAADVEEIDLNLHLAKSRSSVSGLATLPTDQASPLSPTQNTLPTDQASPLSPTRNTLPTDQASPTSPTQNVPQTTTQEVAQQEEGSQTEKEGAQAMDAVLLALGWKGKYQVHQLLYLMLCINPVAFNILSIVFLGKQNKFSCRKVDNMTSNLIPADANNVTYGACSVTWGNVSGGVTKIGCPNGYQFADPVDRSLMSEWELVCGDRVLLDVSQSLLLFGMMVGAVVFTLLADKFGRKPFHIGCHIGLLGTGLAQAFVTSFSAFLPLRFLLGAFQQGTTLTGGILGLEVFPTTHRFKQSAAVAFMWSLGMVLLASLAFLMRNYPWRYLQLVISGFSAYSVFQYWFTDESLRWLVENGKIRETERILKKAAALNKVSEEEIRGIFRTKVLKQSFSKCHTKSFLNAGDLTSRQEGLPQYGVKDFFRNKHVFLCTIINGYAWLVNATTYYGLSITSVSLTSNMYLGFFLNAMVELPAAALMFLIERIGRKKCCDIFHTIAGLSLLLAVTLSTLTEGTATTVAVVALTLLGKMAISVTFAILFLYTPEQFPTNLRNAGLGVASMSGRIGGMIAPFSKTLSRHIPWGPGVIFGVCVLSLPLFMRMLPETCGRELPQTIEQMEEYISAPYEIKRKTSQKKNTVK